MEIRVHLNPELEHFTSEFEKIQLVLHYYASGIIEPGPDHQFSSLNGSINSNHFICKTNPIIIRISNENLSKNFLIDLES